LTVSQFYQNLSLHIRDQLRKATLLFLIQPGHRGLTK
jgi:hypothetical protein